MSLDYDAMQWLVTVEDATYGPAGKDVAVALRDRLRGMGLQAEAWAAAVPMGPPKVLPLRMAP